MLGLVGAVPGSGEPEPSPCEMGPHGGEGRTLQMGEGLAQGAAQCLPSWETFCAKDAPRRELCASVREKGELQKAGQMFLTEMAVQI